MNDPMTSVIRSATLLFSGGQDSTVCLYWLLSRGCNRVYALSVNYGQRHDIEVSKAKIILANLAARNPQGLHLTHEIVYLPGDTLTSTSPLIDLSQDVETYQSVQRLPEGIEKTFVPMRNLLLMTIAANRAVTYDTEALVLGVSEEDFGGYPDCRRNFIDCAGYTINQAVAGFTSRDIRVVTPLLGLTKKETVQLGERVGASEGLAHSHTCYKGRYDPCLTCHSCLLRSKGFAQAKVPDPMVLRLQSEGWLSNSNEFGEVIKS